VAIRRLFLAVLLACGLNGAARAAEWSLSALEGDARSFVNGEWTALRAGDAIARDHLVESRGRLHVTQGGDTLDVAPGAKLRLEGETYRLVRLFEGSLGVTVEPDKARPFLLMTTFAQITTEGAGFDVTAEPFGATVAVREGVVEVTDLTNRALVDVKQGEILHLRAGRTNAPALAAAGNSATAPTAPKPAPTPEALTKISALDHLSTGAIRPAARGDARLADEALERLRDEKRKANLGKADPRTFAVAAAITRELLEGVKYEPEPWDDSFQWTEVENGELRLKPLWKIFAHLAAPESYEFWFLTFTLCLLLGALATTITEKSGFGVFGSTMLVILAFALAILVRDLLFRHGANISIEPYMTVGMMIAAMPALLLGGVAVRHRFP